MSPKKRIEHLTDLIRQRWPAALVTVDPPARATGRWFVDVDVSGQMFVVELSPKVGFGLSSTPGEGYGEKADEFSVDAEGIVARMVVLVR